MNQIIGYLDNKTIGYLDCQVIDNIGMNNPIKYPDFSRRLTQIWKECAAAPVKQTQLAKWLGFAQPTVNNWINGNALPGLETAVVLADKLGCNPIWLITGKGAKDTAVQPPVQGYLESANLSPEQLALIKGMIAQFEQTNPVKAENKSLTYPTENVGGGVKEPSASYSVKLPVQRAQTEAERETELSKAASDGSNGGHKIAKHPAVSVLDSPDYNCGHKEGNKIKKPYISKLIKFVKNNEEAIKESLK